MGDRGNIKIKADGDHFPADVYFYTHWRGSDMPEIVANALARGRGRWSDPSYLARVIFCELVGDDEGETGFGIAGVAGDNEYPFVTIDMKAKTVCRESDPRERFKHCKAEGDTAPASFDDWILKHAPAVTA